VVRPGDAALARLFEEEGLEVAFCSRAEEGMGASLAFGVGASREADSWIVALADMPFVRPETVDGVAGLLRAGSWIAAPASRGRRGHPVGFARDLFHELIALEGDLGAREILRRYADRVRHWETDDPGIFLDIDTLRDLRGSRTQI
jgi:molybdenum cofactor cytidylyltransferase